MKAQSKNNLTESKSLGPTKGDFIVPPPVPDEDERADALPDQEEFWRPPVRFGSIPVEKEPLGWDRRRGFRKAFPFVSLPFQVVDRISLGHPELEPNRLFWGDNLHVMRQLPSESIDLLYLDPPFFSGRQYNVIFGDQNELRSFSDIWEGGMPGYLIWLNARLYEMKRLLKKTGSLYVHLDRHAVHYVKVELDKMFGVERFINEIIWCYKSPGRSGKYFKRKHDTILLYAKSADYFFSQQRIPLSESTLQVWGKYFDKNGQITYGNMRTNAPGMYKRLTMRGTPDDDEVFLDTNKGSPALDWWEDLPFLNKGKERIGYPTQKPEDLLERIINTSCPQGGIVADFFCGGGTSASAAQRSGRRWVTCDQSRVAVAITADRLTRQAEDEVGRLLPVPDFTVEHWGVYEARRLAITPRDQFRQFVLRAFGATPSDGLDGSHGMKGAVPVWVGEPDPKNAATAEDVQAFANAIRKSIRYRQDNLRDGIMLAWAFRADALEAAERLRRLELTDLNFVRLEQIRVDSPIFREHVAALSTDNADYQTFLTFVQSPRVEVGYKRIAPRTYKFDVSDTIVSNAGAKIINVQWDFDYQLRFTSTPGFSFVRGANKGPAIQVQYEFPSKGTKQVACKVQDDMGGEGLWSADIKIE
jgi:DNA modification methylase